jgi:hypothetical protein
LFVCSFNSSHLHFLVVWILERVEEDYWRTRVASSRRLEWSDVTLNRETGGTTSNVPQKHLGQHREMGAWFFLLLAKLELPPRSAGGNCKPVVVVGIDEIFAVCSGLLLLPPTRRIRVKVQRLIQSHARTLSIKKKEKKTQARHLAWHLNFFREIAANGSIIYA